MSDQFERGGLRLTLYVGPMKQQRVELGGEGSVLDFQALMREAAPELVRRCLFERACERDGR